ncbi:aldo/keto reductase [Bradyrhizobium erythrophlei]|uniref:aldo/keto reductase n=1 Tax=Bradyrhizobium erythrophlei TaxID=1437360 RepID=UPI0035EF6CF1
MRVVRVPRLDRDVPAIGFGCASLGSRISAADGRRAIDHAIDLGLRWFDVAPPYGDGRAEALLGQTLRGRRDKVIICTKFGIAPPRVSLPARLIRPAARQIVATFPALRQIAAKARATGTRAPIDPAAIEASVTRSLRMLRTDYIDVLALHEPTPGDAANADIFDVLRRLVERGLIRAVSVAGGPESILEAARTAQQIDMAQFPDTPLTNAAAILRARLATPRPMFVTHGVFGSGIAQIIARMNGQQRNRVTALAERHGIDFSDTPDDLLLRFAFSNNPEGVVIISMYDTKHIERNIAASAVPPSPGFAAALRESLA